MPKNKYGDGLKLRKELPKIDKRFYDTVYAEVGGGHPREVAAVASVFINRSNKEGYEKALRGSSAYRKKSPEYVKAMSGRMKPLEKMVYNRNKGIVDTLIDKPDLVAPFTHFENVKAFGEPQWAKGMRGVDIGRQRFYIKE